MSCVAIIPARGGSKRIPHKNIKLFLGQPMMRYAIAAAQKSNIFDEIIVSTDCETVAGVARDCGANTPFIRPKNLADDFTGTQAVTRHALTELNKQKKYFEFVCCIYATNPLLEPANLVKGLQKLQCGDCDYVVSAVEFEFPIQRALIKSGDYVIPQQPSAMAQRSQDLMPAYHDAAQFYWGTNTAYLNDQALWGENTQAIILSTDSVQDIDNPSDWTMAELKYRQKFIHQAAVSDHG